MLVVILVLGRHRASKCFHFEIVEESVPVSAVVDFVPSLLKDSPLVVIIELCEGAAANKLIQVRVTPATGPAGVFVDHQRIQRREFKPKLLF
ncbi:hypothetical protein D3C76_1212890 [compost metagenome]